ncbi:MAG: glycosyltransferase [Rhodocyclaceae bacterium]
MLRSLHILGSRQGGGAERFVVRLVQGLRAAGHQALCILPPQAWSRTQLGEHIDNHTVAMRGVWDLPSRWHINRLIKVHRPDIVQTYMGRATRLTHLPRGARPVHIARLGGYYDLKGYRHAHAWIGNTRGICEYLIGAGLPAERVFHIGNFVEEQDEADAAELAAVRRRHGIPTDAWLLLAVGRLHPNKGFDDLLAAMDTLPERIGGKTVHLLIAGDGPLRNALHRQANSSSSYTRIHWAGWIDRPAAYYQAADLFICPSRHEPLGNVILEAWAHRRPVVATASAGACELITAERNGLLTPVEQPQALAATIESALVLPEPARTALGENGLNEVRTQHAPEVIIRRYLNLYAQLANAIGNGRG